MNNPWIIRNPAANWSASRYKASATLKERDLRGVKKLANLAGNQYTKGVLQFQQSRLHGCSRVEQYERGSLAVTSLLGVA
jgi:hypothetical protein